MIGKKKKFLSDFAVGLYTSRWILLPAKELTSGKSLDGHNQAVIDVVNNSHIYLISKFPSFQYDKDSIVFQDGYISGKLKYKVKGENKFIEFKNKFPLLDGAIDIKISDYPHREIVSVDDNGVEIRDLPANMIGIRQGILQKIEGLNSFEVLYVGQAFGDGTRTTFDRLRSHSTLQKILADVSYNFPDDEVYILSFEYEPYQIFSNIDGRAKNTITGKDDVKRFYNILQNKLSPHQQICLAEAGLIRYFQPQYNKVYKDNFPSIKYKVLEECYSLDFSGLIVEINTEELGVLLFSESVKPNYHHIANINLINHEDRYGFFHFTFDEDNKPVKIPKDLIE